MTLRDLPLPGCKHFFSVVCWLKISGEKLIKNWLAQCWLVMGENVSGGRLESSLHSSATQPSNVNWCNLRQWLSFHTLVNCFSIQVKCCYQFGHTSSENWSAFNWLTKQQKVSFHFCLGELETDKSRRAEVLAACHGFKFCMNLWRLYTLIESAGMSCGLTTVGNWQDYGRTTRRKLGSWKLTRRSLVLSWSV